MIDLVEPGTREHYEDPVLYDYEYRRRRRDVNYYRALAREMGGGRPLRILELGSGSGRLLIPLVRDGHAVVGMDRSRPMLRRCAERLARLPAHRQRSALLVHADFRAFPLSARGAGRFPLILCPFNAFMHLYTREDAERLLAQVRDHLTPGGLFAFDVLNPDVRWLARDPERRWARTRFRHPRTGARLLYSTAHIYDPVSQIAVMRLYYDPDPRFPSEKGAVSEVVHLAHRQFFPEELAALLHYNGFSIERREGDFDGQPLVKTSISQVIRARAS